MFLTLSLGVYVASYLYLSYTVANPQLLVAVSNAPRGTSAESSTEYNYIPLWLIYRRQD